MRFIPEPSLEHIALVKIAVTLWNQKDVRDLMLKFSFPPYSRGTDEGWKKIEETAAVKVSHLSLPQFLKEKLLGFINSIGMQILFWINFHHRYLHVKLPIKLFWTPQGTVDRKRTAEVFVKDKNLDVSIRYKLACIYCFEKDIHEFWKTMPKDLKKSLLEDTGLPHIVNFWSVYMKKRRIRNVYYSNRYKFEHCATVDNKVAAEYFLKKLTPREREKSLIGTTIFIARCRNNTEVLYFLLSEIDEQQQIKVLRHNPALFLQHFLQWPFQSFFIEIANCFWDFLNKFHYHILLNRITNKHTSGYKDWNYTKLFREFWHVSPKALRSFSTDGLDEAQLLLFLFDIKAKENIRLMFKDATLTIQEKLIYSSDIHNFFEDSIRNNEWDLLEFYVQECLISKAAVLKFKEIFEKHIMLGNVEDNLVNSNEKWDQLFRFSDDSIYKYNKTSVEEGERS